MSWARSRFGPHGWPGASDDWLGLGDRLRLLQRSNPIHEQIHEGLHAASFADPEQERSKKFLGESAHAQGGHSLQGLWAMPGRR